MPTSPPRPSGRRPTPWAISSPVRFCGELSARWFPLPNPVWVRIWVSRKPPKSTPVKSAQNIRKQARIFGFWPVYGRDGHFRYLLNLGCQENGTNKNLEHIQWGNIFIIIRFLSFNIWMFATSKPFTSCQPNFVIIKPLYCPRNNSFRQKHI